MLNAMIREEYRYFQNSKVLGNESHTVQYLEMSHKKQKKCDNTNRIPDHNKQNVPNVLVLLHTGHHISDNIT